MFSERMRPKVIQPLWAALLAGAFITGRQLADGHARHDAASTNWSVKREPTSLRATAWTSANRQLALCIRAPGMWLPVAMATTHQGGLPICLPESLAFSRNHLPGRP